MGNQRITKMEYEQLEPVSPVGQYFNSSVLSLCVIAVLELEVPIDDSPTLTLLNDVFLPITPRFSSIMVMDTDGSRRWKRVEVELVNHVKYAKFPAGLSPASYDGYFDEYLTNLGMEELPQNQPLWELHIIKYPTSCAAGTVVFKIHHSLGDGYSLMGALLSCLQNAANPSLPLRFPLRVSQSSGFAKNKNDRFLTTTVPKFISSIYHTLSDFGGSLMKSLLEDNTSPIRSGNPLVQYMPKTNTTIVFSLDQIKQIKSNLGVTVNDVISGVLFLGTRLYMKAIDDPSGANNITAIVLLNTRMGQGYKSVKEMLKPSAGSTPIWGNQFAFLHIPVPAYADSDSLNPLEFVFKTHNDINTKKSSLGFVLTAKFLELKRKLQGSEAVAKDVYNSLKNSSLAISHVIGPVEQVSLANHPVSGLYFTVSGVPESLIIGIMSYMNKLTLSIGCEKDFIVRHKYKSCLERAFSLIAEAANKPK